MGFKTKLFLLIVIISLATIAGLALYDPTRPMLIGTFTQAGIILGETHASLVASAWWMSYGVYIIGGGMLFTGMLLSALYYKGKFKIIRSSVQEGAKAVGWQTTPPSQTPSPATAPPVPIPVEAKKEA